MRIEMLREFVEVARYQNITLAAKRTFLAQPTLSNHIAALEKEVGVKLVTHGQTVELTAAGRVFFEGCRELLANLDGLLEKTQRIANDPEPGSLTIKMAFGDDKAAICVMELLGTFHKEHPSVQLRIVGLSNATAEDELSEGKVDLVQVYERGEQFRNPSGPYRTIRIDSEQVVFAAKHGHPLLAKEVLALTDAIAYPYAMPAGAGFEELEQSALRIFTEQNLQLTNIHYKAVDSLQDLLILSLEDDEYLLLGSNSQVPPTIETRQFDPSIEHGINLVYRSDNPNPVLTAFAEHVHERLGRAPR